MLFAWVSDGLFRLRHHRQDDLRGHRVRLRHHRDDVHRRRLGHDHRDRHLGQDDRYLRQRLRLQPG